MTGNAAGAAKGSPLRQRMIEQMQIANLAGSTQSAYLFEVERSGEALRDLAGRSGRRAVARLGPETDRPGSQPVLDQLRARRLQVPLYRDAGLPRARGRAAQPQEAPRAAAPHGGRRGRAPDPGAARPPPSCRLHRRLRRRASRLRDRGRQGRRHQVGQEVPAHPVRQGRRRADGPVAGRGHPLPAQLLEEHLAAAGNLAILRRFARPAHAEPGPAPGLQAGARQARHRSPPYLPQPASLGRHPSSRARREISR